MESCETRVRVFNKIWVWFYFLRTKPATKKLFLHINCLKSFFPNLTSEHFTCFPENVVRIIAVFGLESQKCGKTRLWMPEHLEQLNSWLERLNTPMGVRTALWGRFLTLWTNFRNRRRAVLKTLRFRATWRQTLI